MKQAKPTSARCAPTNWTPREDAILKAHYPCYRTLKGKLPHRTLASLKHRIRRLDIVARRHVWTNVEVRRLHSAYGAGVKNEELLRLFPGLRLCQIRSKAGHVKAPRRRSKLARFDQPAIAAIRERAWLLGLSFVELDRRARIGKYFQKSVRQPVLWKIARAASELGGEVDIAWEPDEL